jgi:hypothetical protein
LGGLFSGDPGARMRGGKSLFSCALKLYGKCEVCTVGNRRLLKRLDFLPVLSGVPRIEKRTVARREAQKKPR